MTDDFDKKISALAKVRCAEHADEETSVLYDEFYELYVAGAQAARSLLAMECYDHGQLLGKAVMEKERLEKENEQLKIAVNKATDIIIPERDQLKKELDAARADKLSLIETNKKCVDEIIRLETELAEAKKQLTAKRTLNALIADNAEICEAHDENDRLRKALKQALPLLKVYTGGVWGEVTRAVEKALGIE